MIYLPLKAVLQNRYVVGNVVSYGSDAVTYVGYDAERRAAVTIREFLPKNIANRLEGNFDIHVRERFKKNFMSYKNSFIHLWETLKELNSLSAVIPVVDVFEANGTAYAVCEKMDAVSLREFLIRNPDNHILWDKARLMFMPILTTLENLHAKGIIHGGINPDNLVLCRDGKVRLAGFSISECSESGGDLEFTPVAGYSALEQYQNSHRVCPATDIYAFSACIYRALVGTNPPDATDRETNDKLMIPNSIAEKIPAHVIRALGGGLQIYPENRVQNVEDFRELLSAAPSVVAQAVAAAAAPINEKSQEEKEEEAPEKTDDKKKSSGKLRTLVIDVIILLIVVGVATVLIKFANKTPEESGNTTVPTDVQKVSVPDFCTAGYTEEEISNQALWMAQFHITIEYEYSTDVEEKIIFKQSVDSGSEVDTGTEIVLTVSKGIETVRIPDVGGMNKDDAVRELEAQEFKVSIVPVYNDGTHTPNTVKTKGGITPQEQTVVAKGEEIIIQVYGEVATTESSTEAEANPNQNP